MPYTVLVLDSDGCELSNTEEETLKAAKASAWVSLKDRELIASGAVKVEVRDAKGCVWDKFVKRTTATARALQSATDRARRNNIVCATESFPETRSRLKDA